MPQTIGRATRLIGTDDLCVVVNGRHYRIRESDARRLLLGNREADIYTLTGHTRQGSVLAGKEFYRLKIDYNPIFAHMNRFNLLISGEYWFSPLIDWCREAGQ